MLGCYNKVSFIQVCWRLGQAWPRSIPFTLADLNNNYHISKKGRVKRQEGDAWKLCPGQEKPPLPLSELVDVAGRKKWARFFNLAPSVTPTIFPLLLSLPPLLHWIQCFCAAGQSVVKRQGKKCCCVEQQLLLARSKGQQAWSSWPNAALEVFDGQSTAGAAQPAM